MYNIAICEDGQNICNALESMILHYTTRNQIQVQINIFYSGEGLCNYLRYDNSIELLFLDIELIEMNGIEVGNFIRNQLEDRGMQIVYISAKSSYSQKLFKTQPMDFLVKPILQEQMDEVLELAFKILLHNNEKFEFQKGKNYYYISFGKIMYFVAEGRKIRIVMEDREDKFYGKLKNITNRLSNEFISIHQSYIVNRKYINHYTYETIELFDKTVLPISKVNKKKVRENLLRGN